MSVEWPSGEAFQACDEGSIPFTRSNAVSSLQIGGNPTAFIPSALRVPSGFASSSIQHVLHHADGNIRHDARLEDCIEEISVPCATLHALIARLSWTNDVDILQVDEEGADDDVIYASDTPSLKPRLINYERRHLTEEKQHSLEAFLTRQGYRRLHWSGSDTVAVLHR